MSSGSKRRPHTAGDPHASQENSLERGGDIAGERLDQHEPLHGTEPSVAAAEATLRQHAFHATERQLFAARTHKRSRTTPPAPNDGDGTSSEPASSNPKRRTAAPAKPRSSCHRRHEPPSLGADLLPTTRQTDRTNVRVEEPLESSRPQHSSAFGPPVPPPGENMAPHINLLLLNHSHLASLVAAAASPSSSTGAAVPLPSLNYSHPALSQAFFSLSQPTASAVRPASAFGLTDHGLAVTPPLHPVFSGLNLTALAPPAPTTAMIDPRLAAAALLLNNNPHQQPQLLAPPPPPTAAGTILGLSEQNPYVAALAAAWQSTRLAGLLTAASAAAGAGGPPHLLQPSSNMLLPYARSSGDGSPGLPIVGSSAGVAVPPHLARRLALVLSEVPAGNTSATANAAAASSSSTPLRALTGRLPVSLYMECDSESLSAQQCIVRRQIEVFEALQSDVDSNAQGRNRPIVLGRVGIRCRHCALDLPKQRARGAVYYPSKLNGLYQAAQNMSLVHLADKCPRVPQSVRDEIAQCRDSRKSSAGGGKSYWAKGVRGLGVYEDSDGLRFEPAVPTANQRQRRRSTKGTVEAVLTRPCEGDTAHQKIRGETDRGPISRR